MNNMLKHDIVLLCILLQSCSMCSHKNVSTTVLSDTIDTEQEIATREVWSILSTIGYPVISDTIPNLLLERYCYSVSYNTFTRQPNWVMWELS